MNIEYIDIVMKLFYIHAKYKVWLPNGLNFYFVTNST